MRDLPALLAEIADVVGLDAALKIADAKGGTKVYFPPQVGESHWLAQLIGRDAANRLCAHLCTSLGDDFLIPLGPTSSRAAAMRRAAAILEKGGSVQAAARAAGVHERTIYYRRAKVKSGDDRQGDLF